LRTECFTGIRGVIFRSARVSNAQVSDWDKDAGGTYLDVVDEAVLAEAVAPKPSLFIPIPSLAMS
jgi:hypothetical protein